MGHDRKKMLGNKCIVYNIINFSLAKLTTERRWAAQLSSFEIKYQSSKNNTLPSLSPVPVWPPKFRGDASMCSDANVFAAKLEVEEGRDHSNCHSNHATAYYF